jgi:cell division protein FtsB
MNNLTQPTTETENYNETILIPILHKKINQLTAENLLLEAQVQILDKEKKALQEIRNKQEVVPTEVINTAD